MLLHAFFFFFRLSLFLDLFSFLFFVFFFSVSCSPQSHEFTKASTFRAGLRLSVFAAIIALALPAAAVAAASQPKILQPIKSHQTEPIVVILARVGVGGPQINRERNWDVFIYILRSGVILFFSFSPLFKPCEVFLRVSGPFFAF